MELSLIAKKEVPVVPFDMNEVKSIYAEILAAQEEVGGTVMYRAKIAAGGGKSFEIITGDEDSDTSVSKIVGVVIHSHQCNARFDESAQGEPPICSSQDGKYGIDAETGDVIQCENCPYNKYGSASKGRGKACKNMIRLYIMIEGSPIPLVLTLPPTSIEGWQNYRLVSLPPKRLKPVDVLTEFTLSPQTSKSGNKYSVVKPKLVGKLDANTSEMMRYFASGFTPQVDVSADDYNVAPPKDGE